MPSRRFGVLSGFHFREEGEALATPDRLQEVDGLRLLAQPYVGGCAVMVRRDVLDELGAIPCRPTNGQKPFMDSGWTSSLTGQPHVAGKPPGDRPFMDSGWTQYQEQIGSHGYLNGYPWPPFHVDHMEDTRSSHCIRTAEHEQYKRELRGMDLEEFTQALCVWRPSWSRAAIAAQEPAAFPGTA